MLDNTKILESIESLIILCEVPRDPIVLSEVVNFEVTRKKILQDNILKGREDFNLGEWKSSPLATATVSHHPVGLNTIGMLIDRLSILVIKKTIQNNKTDLGVRLQIEEMLLAIQYCQRGKSSSFNKITTIQAANVSNHSVDIILNLAFVNLLLWLAQDVLYLRGAGALPDEELRDYINYFAKKNVLRNQLISDLALFWRYSN